MSWFEVDDAGSLAFGGDPDVHIYVRVWPPSSASAEQQQHRHQGLTVGQVVGAQRRAQTETHPAAHFFWVLTQIYDYLTKKLWTHEEHSFLATLHIAHEPQLRLVAHLMAQISPIFGCRIEAHRAITRRLAKWDITDVTLPMISAATMRQIGKSESQNTACAHAVIYCTKPSKEEIAERMQQLDSSKRKRARIEDDGEPHRKYLLYHENMRKNKDNLASVRAKIEVICRERNIHYTVITNSSEELHIEILNKRVKVTCAVMSSSRGYGPDMVCIDETLRMDASALNTVIRPFLGVPGRTGMAISTPVPEANSELLNMTTLDTSLSVFYSSSTVCSRPECNKNTETRLKCRHIAYLAPPWYPLCVIERYEDMHPLEFLREKRGATTAIDSQGINYEALQRFTQRRRTIGPDDPFKSAFIILDFKHGGPSEMGCKVGALMTRDTRPGSRVTMFRHEFVVSTIPAPCAHAQPCLAPHTVSHTGRAARQTGLESAQWQLGWCRCSREKRRCSRQKPAPRPPKSARATAEQTAPRAAGPGAPGRRTCPEPCWRCAHGCWPGWCCARGLGTAPGPRAGGRQSRQTSAALSDRSRSRPPCRARRATSVSNRPQISELSGGTP